MPPGSVWRDRILALIAPLLLIAVAVLQMVRVQTLDQSAWSGAGMGMFARYEAENTRVVRVLTSGEDQVRYLELSPEVTAAIAAEEKALLVVPTENHADQLARAIAEHLDGDEPVIVELWALRIERDPWRLEYDPLTIGFSSNNADRPR